MPQTTLSSWFVNTQSISRGPEKGQHHHDLDNKGLSEVSKTGSSPEPSQPFTQEPSREYPSTTKWLNLPPLPSKAQIVPCTEDHIRAFRRLNALLLPIPYQDGFYKETLGDPVIASITRVATWGRGNTTSRLTQLNGKEANSDMVTANELNQDQLVAAIRCRLLACQPQDSLAPGPVLYISTIGTLAPFRCHSLGAHLLAEVTRAAVEDYHVSAVMAHVWEANEDAMAWYTKRGFTIVAREDDYYRRLAPKTAAWLVKRDVRPSDLLGTTGTAWSAAAG